MKPLHRLLHLVASAAFFIAGSASAQNAGTITNHAFAIGKGPGVAGYASLLCGSAQLAVGQAAADPICQTITGDVTISAGGVTAIGATKVTNAMLNSNVFSTAHTWSAAQTFSATAIWPGSTSGNVTVQANAVAGTVTAKWPFNSGELVAQVTPQSLGFKCDGTTESAILQTAVNALPSTGGVVYFPPGSNCVDSSFVTITKSNVAFIGPTKATGNAAPPNVSRISYTGTNARFIDVRSVTGFQLINLEVTYTSVSSFTGSLIDAGSNNPGVTIAAYHNYKGNYLGPSTNRTGTATLLNLSENVDTEVDQNFFYHGAPAILGQTTQGRNTVAKISKNVFVLSDSVAISSCGEGWLVDQNSFEPTAGGQAQAFSTTSVLRCKGMVWTNNWFGDVTATGGTWIDGFFEGLVFEGNRMAGYSVANTTNGIKLNTSTGVSVAGNTFDFLDNAVDCTTAVTGLMVSGNKMGGGFGGTVTSPLKNAANCTEYATPGNSAAITEWKAYTSTFAATTGTATVTARFRASGKTVCVNISALFTSAVTGTFTVTLPFSALATSSISGKEIAVAGYAAGGWVNASTNTLNVLKYDGSQITANASQLIMSGCYEAS